MSEPLIRVLVIGGEDYTDRAAITKALRHLGEHYIFGARPDQIGLVHGAGGGVDQIAAQEARELGWQVDACPIRRDRYGAAAVQVRDQEMIAARPNPHYCLAFPGGDATRRQRRLALNAGIPVIEINAGVHHG
jgi:hypothetical protein